MIAKKMEALEGEMKQLRVGMEEKYSGMEKFTTVEGAFIHGKHFENLEDMMRKLIEMQSKTLSAFPTADLKGKKVQEDDDKVESVFPQDHPRGFR
ncbi:hypothetical protein M5K25_009088 [Dendrobium thyrsiflorum]|uniref:Uncharacterized protein n=1 Tax=Dendrobium thyrsiflorum TaxID=117978 RepID=A0ABD0VBL7_DENTH